MEPDQWDDLIDILCMISIEPISDIQVRIDAIKQVKIILELDPKFFEYIEPAKEFFQQVKMA
jgi:hypothetical protein